MPELPLSKRIFYGMGGLTMVLPDLIIMQWLLVRYMPADPAKHLAPPLLFGIAFLAGRIVEGLSNPVIGNFSDQCTSRWGRRLPFMRFGIVPLALVFFLLFNPPVDHRSWINAAYALVLMPGYSLLYATNITPYLSLLPEITADPKERVDLTTFQSLFVMIGTFIFAGLPGLLYAKGWAAFAGCAAVLMIVFFIPAITQIQEKPRAKGASHEPLHLGASIMLALRNRPFRFVIAATAVFWFGLNGVIALVPHWTLNVLGGHEGDVPFLMLPFLLVNVVFFFVINLLSRRYGKYPLMLATFLASAVIIAGFIAVGWFPMGSAFMQTAIIMALFGAPAAGFMVLPFAVLSDVVDYDERLTGRRREAIYFGVQGIFQRGMVGISMMTFTLVPYLHSDGSRMLSTERPLTFTGIYQSQQPDASPAPAEAPPASAGQPALKPGDVRVDVLPAAANASWTLWGPEGKTVEGTGSQTISDCAPGQYRIVWKEAPGWITPQTARTATPFGLKTMAGLCAAAAAIAFFLFLRYPIRERNGRTVLIGPDGSEQPLRVA